MGRIRVLVADGHRIFAEALATALGAEADVDVTAAGSAAAAERALERAANENRPFHVLLVDADLGPGAPPGSAGTQGTAPGQSPGAVPGGTGPSSAALPAGSRTPDLRASDLRRAPVPPQRGPVQLPAQRTAGPASPAGASSPAGPSGPTATPPSFVPPTSPPAAVAPAAGSAAGSRPPGPRIPGPRLAAGRGNPAESPATDGSALPGGGPPGDGIAFVARARAAHPALQVVVLAVDDQPRRVVQALLAGASAWVAKESSLGRLTAVIRGVLRDETHIPPLLLTGVLRELTAARRDRTESERLVESLTPREKQVLRCMVAGLGRQAVADRLFLSPHTVRTHMQNVLGKLGVHSTLAAVAVARRAGVGPVE